MVLVILTFLNKFTVYGGSCSESGRSKSCQFDDYLKIDFHDWMTIRILLCYLLPLDSNIASVERGA